MSMLAFFPWWGISGEGLRVAEFEVVPYLRGRSPAGSGTPEQDQIDAVLEPYLWAVRVPVDRAAILRLQGRSTTGDLTEAERADFFVFRQSLTIAALARREYFNTFAYSNADNFALIIQAFGEDPRQGVATTSRRRDVVVRAFVSGSAFRVDHPDHVGVVRHPIDVPLLQALVAARERREWDRYFEAIVAFNLSNSDSSQMMEETEAVQTIGAFQRLLRCQTSNVSELASELFRCIRPATSLSPIERQVIAQDATLTAKYAKWSTLREAWLRDFCAQRGQLAHGRLTPVTPSAWGLREHLLLAAFLFPRVLKMCLAEDGLYNLTPEDESDINWFEAFAKESLFVSTADEESETPWQRVRSAQVFDRLHVRTLRNLGLPQRSTDDEG